MSSNFIVRLSPNSTPIEATEGENLLSLINRANGNGSVNSSCNGTNRGTCGQCKVRVSNPDNVLMRIKIDPSLPDRIVSYLTSEFLQTNAGSNYQQVNTTEGLTEDEYNSGVRLACISYVYGPTSVSIPTSSQVSTGGDSAVPSFSNDVLNLYGLSVPNHGGLDVQSLINQHLGYAINAATINLLGEVTGHGRIPVGIDAYMVKPALNRLLGFGESTYSITGGKINEFYVFNTGAYHSDFTSVYPRRTHDATRDELKGARPVNMNNYKRTNQRYQNTSLPYKMGGSYGSGLFGMGGTLADISRLDQIPDNVMAAIGLKLASSMLKSLSSPKENNPVLDAFADSMDVDTDEFYKDVLDYESEHDTDESLLDYDQEEGLITEYDMELDYDADGDLITEYDDVLDYDTEGDLITEYDQSLDEPISLSNTNEPISLSNADEPISLANPNPISISNVDEPISLSNSSATTEVPQPVPAGTNTEVNSLANPSTTTKKDGSGWKAKIQPSSDLAAFMDRA